MGFGGPLRSQRPPFIPLYRPLCRAEHVTDLGYVQHSGGLFVAPARLREKYGRSEYNPNLVEIVRIPTPFSQRFVFGFR